MNMKNLKNFGLHIGFVEHILMHVNNDIRSVTRTDFARHTRGPRFPDTPSRF